MSSSNPFVNGWGAYQNKLQQIVEALSPTKTAALEFQEADDSIFCNPGKLGRKEQPDGDIKSGIQRFVCQLYLPKTDQTTHLKSSGLRWFLFRKKQAESDQHKLHCTKLYSMLIFS